MAVMRNKMKIKKGDTVIVIAGKEKGKQGAVLRAIPADRRVVVEGINVVKRHTRPSAGQPGGIVEKEAAIHVSNVALVDPKNGKATRVGRKRLEDGRSVRYAKASGEIIDR